MLQIINPAIVGSVVAATVFIGIIGFLAVGRNFGLRAITRHGETGLASSGSIEAAVFALLGLLIAFTFSGALTRFDERRGQVVAEANAIGTAYLRIDVLAPSTQPRLREAFRQYVDSRIATYSKLPNLQAAEHELQQSQQLQTEIWAQAVAAVRLPDSHASAGMLVLPALNEMFDITTVRVAATQMHPPSIIFVMLVGLAFAAALLAGYQAAGEKDQDWLHKVGFAGIVACTIYVILDIEYPRLGLIRIDAIDQVLANVRAGMK
jgi:hypothetical protein